MQTIRWTGPNTTRNTIGHMHRKHIKKKTWTQDTNSARPPQYVFNCLRSLFASHRIHHPIFPSFCKRIDTLQVPEAAHMQTILNALRLKTTTVGYQPNWNQFCSDLIPNICVPFHSMQCKCIVHHSLVPLLLTSFRWINNDAINYFMCL